MKVFSVWQPWATLLVRGFKRIETRSWPAPKSLIGQRLGIASTASVKGEQMRAFSEANFARHYAETELPELHDLPFGRLLGSAVLAGCVPITQELVNTLTPAEHAFGWYGEGRWAWLLKDEIELASPIPVKGRQGLWEIDDGLVQKADHQHAGGQEGSPDIRGDLHPA